MKQGDCVLPLCHPPHVSLCLAFHRRVTESLCHSSSYVAVSCLSLPCNSVTPASACPGPVSSLRPWTRQRKIERTHFSNIAPPECFKSPQTEAASLLQHSTAVQYSTAVLGGQHDIGTLCRCITEYSVSHVVWPQKCHGSARCTQLTT